MTRFNIFDHVSIHPFPVETTHHLRLTPGVATGQLFYCRACPANPAPCQWLALDTVELPLAQSSSAITCAQNSPTCHLHTTSKYLLDPGLPCTKRASFDATAVGWRSQNAGKESLPLLFGTCHFHSKSMPCILK